MLLQGPTSTYQDADRLQQLQQAQQQQQQQPQLQQRTVDVEAVRGGVAGSSHPATAVAEPVNSCPAPPSSHDAPGLLIPVVSEVTVYAV